MINIMFFIPKIGDYVKILTEEKVKDFVAIHFSEYFKSTEKNKILEKLLNDLSSF